VCRVACPTGADFCPSGARICPSVARICPTVSDFSPPTPGVPHEGSCRFTRGLHTHLCRPTLAAVGRAAAAPCGRPEAAGAAPPAPRPLQPDCQPLHCRRPRSTRHLHLHHLQLPPLPLPSSSADSSNAHPALLGPCALQVRPRMLLIGLLTASCVAGDAVPVPFASSRTPLPRLPAPFICARLCCSRVAGCGSEFEFGCRKPG
jgi:hypothetical protein